MAKLPTILVVEDDVDLVELLTAYLKVNGWEVVPAASESECRRRLKTVRPDVILLDLVLLDTNGLEIAQSLKQDDGYREIPILAMTGLPSQSVQERCFSAGCSDVMLKPFPLASLQRRLKYHVSGGGRHED